MSRTGSAIRIGTRGSALALAQARMVAAALASRGRAAELVVIETAGDRRAPDTAWGEGAFVAAIEKALLENRVDVAVHSAKDVPTDEDARLSIAAYLPREDPRDALVVPPGSARSIATLPRGSRVGTDSPRRSAFLRAARPDLVVTPIHGNVDTRLRRLDAGEADALILAVAGLVRLGLADRIAERVAPELVPPAPGQGAIAVQVRAGDVATRAAVETVDDPATRLAVSIERTFLRAAGGGCRSPIGALARLSGDEVELLVGLADANGITAVERTLAPPARAGDAAAALAAELVGRTGRGGRRPVVVVTRPADQAGRLVDGLEARGIGARVVPAIAIEPLAGGELDDAVGGLTSTDWAIVTSGNGARAVIAAAARTGVAFDEARWAAVGPATAEVLRAGGAVDVWMPSISTSAALGDELPLAPGSSALVFAGSQAGGRLSERLRGRGATVRQVLAYRTVEAPEASRSLLERVLDGPPPAAVIFASGSAIRGLVSLAAPSRSEALRAIPAICIGPETSAAAADAGFAVIGEARTQSADSVAALAGRLLATNGVPR